MNVDGRLRFGRMRDLRAFEVIADDRTFFLCQSQRPDGSWGEAKMDLDRVIGNDDGLLHAVLSCLVFFFFLGGGGLGGADGAWGVCM